MTIQQKLLKEEIKQKMIALQEERDLEEAHVIADGLLCELLRAFGCKDVVIEFIKIEKWYA